MKVWKLSFLSNGVNFRFHVSFWGGVGDFFSLNFCAVLMGIRCSHGVRKYQPNMVVSYCHYDILQSRSLDMRT